MKTFLMLFLGLLTPHFPQNAKEGAQESATPATESAQAFEKLQQEVRSLVPKSRENWNEDLKVFMAQAKVKLSDFAQKFPKTPESYQARFQLAQLHLEVEKNLKAGLEVLQSVFEETEGQKELRSKALFLIAKAQMDFQEWANSKGSFELLIQDFPGSPYEAAAKAYLEDLESQKKLAVGSAPIHFEVNGLTGEKLSPKAFEGKVLLIDFWATWCGPCKAELPNVLSTYKKHQAEGFAILGISLDKSEEKLRQFIQEKGMQWPQFFDGKEWKNQVAQLYAIRSIPATYLVDRKGKIRYKNLRGEQLEEKVTELLAEKN